MKKLIILISLIIGLSISETYAQGNFKKGYIITLKNDTIYGQIVKRATGNVYASCQFSQADVLIEYLPQEIIGYGYLKGANFISTVTESTFVEVLVSGDLSLYKSRSNFILKKDDEVYSFKSANNEDQSFAGLGLKEDNRWRDIVANLVRDCIENSTSFVKTVKLNKSSLTKLVRQYNLCKDVNSIAFKGNRPLFKFNVGATIGIINSSIEISDPKLQYQYIGKSFSSLDPTFGLVFDLALPRFNDHLIFQPEIHFTRTSYITLVELPNSFHDTIIELSTVSIPLSIKYSVPVGRTYLFAQMGINSYINISKNARLLSENVFKSTTQATIVRTLPDKTAFEVKRIQLGFFGGVGIQKSFNKIMASGTIRYYILGNLIKTDGLTSSGSQFSLNIIIYKK
jgi:hypothetical protein